MNVKAPIRKWMRRMWPHTEAMRAADWEITSLKGALEACQQRLQALENELFEVPALPSLRFQADPLGNQLARAKAEHEAFLKSDASVSTKERAYLLMQMFFRGSVEHISSELTQVVQSIEISESARSLPVWDLGCGRGELLEIFKRSGYRAIGVETSQLMVDKLRERGLETRHGDAVGELRKVDDNSLAGVAAFHVIEHLQPEYLRDLLDSAFQKVASGGFVLLETPNPYCFEALSFFFTDETHVRPIQPHQLAFLVEQAGFSETQAYFSAPIPVGRRQAMDNWIRHYQNHGLVATKP